MNQEPNQDRLLEHEYDGIREYDNPLPGWWVWIFLATILFAALYFVNVPGIGVGKGRIADYERDVAKARATYGDRMPAAGTGPGDPELLAMAADPAKLDEGRKVFETNCVACHRADGGGLIGPNLTDDYWIHGGRPSQVLRTITTGVPDKGMPTWGTVLKPADLPVVAAYVLHLHGTHPVNPKAPQGTLVEGTAAEAGTH